MDEKMLLFFSLDIVLELSFP